MKNSLIKTGLIKRVGSVLLLMTVLFTLTACGGQEPKLKDGTYSKESSVDQGGGHVVVDIVIKDGKISECQMKMLDKDGKEKDENYGNFGDANQFKLAQAAIKEAAKYPGLLVEAGDIDEVSAISGATVTYDSFKEAVDAIIEEATIKE